jgi:hypothetical protein
MSAVDRVSDILIDWNHESIAQRNVYTTSDMQARAEVIAMVIVKEVLGEQKHEPVEQYRCPSYVDDDGVLRNCLCGNCR